MSDFMGMVPIFAQVVAGDITPIDEDRSGYGQKQIMVPKVSMICQFL